MSSPVYSNNLRLRKRVLPDGTEVTLSEPDDGLEPDIQGPLEEFTSEPQPHTAENKGLAKTIADALYTSPEEWQEMDANSKRYEQEREQELAAATRGKVGFVKGSAPGAAATPGTLPDGTPAALARPGHTGAPEQPNEFGVLSAPDFRKKKPRVIGYTPTNMSLVGRQVQFGRGPMAESDLQAVQGSREDLKRQEAALEAEHLERENIRLTSERRAMVDRHLDSYDESKARSKSLAGVRGDIRSTEVELVKLDARIEAHKEDPNRYFKERGTLAVIAAALVQGLGAYAAIVGGGKNQAAEVINRGIERDIQAQRADLDKMKYQRGRASNRLRELIDKGYAEDEALQRVRQEQRLFVSAYAAKMAEKEQVKHKHDQLRLLSAQLKHQNLTEQVDNAMQALPEGTVESHKLTGGQAIMGGGGVEAEGELIDPELKGAAGYYVDEEARRKGNKFTMGVQTEESELAEALQIIEDNPSEVHLKGSPANRMARAAASRALNANKTWNDGGSMDEGLVRQYKEIVGYLDEPVGKGPVRALVHGQIKALGNTKRRYYKVNRVSRTPHRMKYTPVVPPRPKGFKAD